MEWVRTSDSLPEKSQKLLVKRKNGDVHQAFFYPDKIGWIAFYGKKPSHFWHADTKQSLSDVTHWQNKTLDKS